MLAAGAHVLIAALASTAAILLWMALAARAHRRRLERIPVRIHVAGSRGKTTVARLIGAGLAAAGRRVVVKTTGTEPMIILPDGRSAPWPRQGPPTIAETVRFFRTVEGLGADAVVIESMAIEPEYLWASERYLVRATHVVITNVRPDHGEVLAGGAEAMAAALAHVVPQGGTAILTDEADAPEIRAACRARGSETVTIAASRLAPEAANLRIAMAACTALGVPAEIAEAGMSRAEPDRGAFSLIGAESHGIRFANAFACNDVVSFGTLWRAHPPTGPTIVLLSARADRPLRTRTFLQALGKLDPPVRLAVAGRVPRRWLRAAGFPPERVLRLKSRAPAAALAEVAEAVGPEGIVWGVGNYAGLGARLVSHLRERG